jgi:DNA-binding NarL/FixJ family response regulator
VTHILLVDDHEVARRGIEGVLADALPGLRFGEAATYAQAISRLRDQRW